MTKCSDCGKAKQTPSPFKVINWRCEDCAYGSRKDARCDDPGAHGPGCKCDGGEPVLA